MNVYVLVEDMGYDGQTNMAVFSTRLAAESYGLKLNQQLDERYASFGWGPVPEHSRIKFVVEEYVLDDPEFSA